MSDLEKAPIETSKLTDELEIKGEGVYTKEELESLSNTAGWNITRKILLGLFWLVWLGAIAWSVIIVVQAPKCAPEPEQAWFVKNNIGFIDGSKNATAQLESVNAGQHQGLMVSGVIPELNVLEGYQNQGELKEQMEAILKSGQSKNAKVLHVVDIGTSQLDADKFEMFFLGYLNANETTDGFIFTCAAKPSCVAPETVAAVRSFELDNLDLFYDVADVAGFMAGRKENEFLFKTVAGEKISDSIEAAKQVFEASSSNDNSTLVADVVETLWYAPGFTASPSDNMVIAAALPGGFVAPTSMDDEMTKSYTSLLELRSKYHSLRAILGASIDWQADSFTRKFDLRPGVQFKTGKVENALFATETAYLVETE